jgi:hypothetical protein
LVGLYQFWEERTAAILRTSKLVGKDAACTDIREERLTENRSGHTDAA